jgi:hypoxanthine-guanine phosphoribosyltransferase
MRTLLTESELRDGVQRLAIEIDQHYGKDQPITLIVGSFC